LEAPWKQIGKMDNSTLEEAEWRAEFERFGEEQVRASLHSGLFPEPKRQFAFRWLGDEAIARRIREHKTYGFARWTLVAALAAVFVGILGVAVALFR
jgi:hypothetical protein